MLPTRYGPSLRILVTGAAGLIGGELCWQLAVRGHRVIALVHRSRRLVHGAGSVMEPPPFFGAPPDPGAVVSMAGDIREAGLALGRATASALAGALDLIVHCAAATGFAASSDLHRGVNVEGIANVVAFARGAVGPAPGIVHLSTAYVCGMRSGAIAEEDLDVGQVFGNRYEASKAKAEALISASGLRTAIARPSIVLGSSETGCIGRFDDVYALLRLICEGRISILPAAPGATLALVPIDHVVGGLIDLVERFEDAAGRVFHIVAEDPVAIAALVAFDYPGFHPPRLVAPEAFNLAALDPTEGFLHRSVVSHYASYWRRDSCFVVRNLRALSGRVCPPTGPGFMRRIIDYAASAGYLRRNPDLLGRSGVSHLISG